MGWVALIIIVLGGSHVAYGHEFEVLKRNTIGTDAIAREQNNQIGGNILLRSILVDGNIKSKGTGATTYDRTLVNELRLWGGVPVAPQVQIQPLIYINGNLQKIEGKEEPRTISERSWGDYTLGLAAYYRTASGLDLVAGIRARYVSAQVLETRTTDIDSKESYESASYTYPYVAIVKRSGAFNGGFYVRQGAEVARKVTKTNNAEESVLIFDDKIFTAPAIGIFANWRQGWGSLYGEFASIQGSEVGNKTDDGASVDEDYIKFQLNGIYEAFGAVSLTGGMTHKTLSYADNRNVYVTTMPMTLVSIGLRLDSIAVPVALELLHVFGKDGQSIQEFNADLKVTGVGGSLSASVQL